MKISSLSASKYNSHSYCPFQYYLSSQLNFTDDGSAATMLGKLAHKFLEILGNASKVKHDPKSRVWDINWLWNTVLNHFYKKEPLLANDIKSDKLKKVIKGTIQLLNSHYTPITDKTIGSEIPFEIEMDEPGFIIDRQDGQPRHMKVRGYIDRIDLVSPDTIEIIDYKSGSGKDWDTMQNKDENSLRKEIQPRMYHLAARHLYPQYKNVIVTFIYFADIGPVTAIFTEKDLVKTKDMLRKKFASIKAEVNPERNWSYKCKFMCGYYRDGNCEKTWGEKNEYGLDYIYNKYTTLNVRGKIVR